MNTGFVYIFDMGGGFLKLGTSINWKKRFSELKAWHKIDLSVVRTWKMGSRSAARVERMAHQILRKKKIERHGNEIYKTSKNMLILAVREATDIISSNIGLAEQLDHNKGHEYTDHDIKSALQKAGSIRGAATVLGRAPITIKRRIEMWERGDKLVHAVKK